MGMNKKAFIEEIGPVKKQLYQTAYMYLGSEADALEAVDEAVYKGYRNRLQLKEEQYFATWMMRILINECKRTLSKRGRITYYDVPIETEETEVAYDHLPLKEAVAMLPIQLREVIILRYFIGYTLAETATILHIPQGTVVTWQRRALALLKLSLQEEVE